MTELASLSAKVSTETSVLVSIEFVTFSAAVGFLSSTVASSAVVRPGSTEVRHAASRRLDQDNYESEEDAVVEFVESLGWLSN